MPLSPTMYRFLWVAAILSAVVAGKRLVESFDASELYRKDFVQEYVFAKAVLAGEEPYARMPDMVERYFDPPPKVNWGHPAPHTPVTAVLSVPLAALPYPIAAFAWLMLEIGLLAYVWSALFRWWGDVPRPTRILLFCLSLSLGPVIQELWFGNLSMILAALLVAAWLALRKGDDVIGGLWLGLAIAIKLTGWPVVVWLFFKWRWRAVLAAGGVIVALHLLAIAAMGSDHVIDYYRRVGPEIARRYRQHDGNYSLWTIGPRLFLEFNSVYNNFIAQAPFVGWLGIEIVWIAIGFGLVTAGRALWKCQFFDSSYGILLCLSLIVNPVAWDHSLLITAIPIAIVLRRLARRNWPFAETTLAVACFVLTMFPQQAYMRSLTYLMATERDGNRFMPFVPGLITYVPLLALVTWMALLWWTDDAARFGSDVGSTPKTPRPRRRWPFDKRVDQES